LTGKVLPYCGLAEDHTDRCWASNQSIVDVYFPDGLDRLLPGHYETISAGGASLCGIDSSSGALDCWADPREDWISEGGPERPRQIEAGSNLAACALDEDGTLACWGHPDDGGWRTAPEGRFETLASGGGNYCALTGAGLATCWGIMWRAFDGLPTDRPFQDIAIANQGVCTLDGEGHAECWGLIVDNNGVPPVPPDPDEVFIELAIGEYHVCGRHPDDSVSCWGSSNAEELGLLDVPEELQ
jgi:hypothetical protein